MMPVLDFNFEDTGSVVSKAGCQAYFARKRGKSHIESGTVCQDYCLVENLEDVFVIAIADGHGGESYTKSDIGARIACETVVSCVKSILGSRIPFLTGDAWIWAITDKEFKTRYIRLWKEAVLKDYQQTYGQVQESAWGNVIRQYGTTILFAVVSREYLALGQLGDGAILMFNEEGQCQLFKRHAVKMSSKTSSLASGRAEYAFMVNVFPRKLFGNVLLSTDGIYDKLDTEGAFLSYAESLLSQVKKTEKLERPFEIEGIDVSEISKDDCTIALMVSDSPTQKHVLKTPPWRGYRNIEFIRGYHGVEIYRAQKKENELEIHVRRDGPLLKKLDVKSCLVYYPEDSAARPQNRRMFSYRLPKGIVGMQKLMEYGEHLEKRYWFNDKDYTPGMGHVDSNLYSNQFWMEIYEKLKLVEKEFEIIKIYPGPGLFDTAYITADRKLLFFADGLRQEGFDKEKLSRAFNSFYERFSIVGKLSCGKISIPLFRCATQGQNINMLHVAGKNSSLGRVIYNKDKKIYGLFNLSGESWDIDDGKGKEIAPQGVLRLNKNHSFVVKSTGYGSVLGAEFVDGFARYEIEIF